MNRTILKYAYTSVIYRAKLMDYTASLPTKKDMISLNKENPTKEEIKKDYSKLSQHFKHPVYSSFVPSYYEASECMKTAWIKRYLDVRSKISFKNKS